MREDKYWYWAIGLIFAFGILTVLVLITKATMHTETEVIIETRVETKIVVETTTAIDDKQLSTNISDYITAKYRKVPVELATVIAETTVELCKKHNIDPYVVVGLMEVESSFNPSAVSKIYARGLLQVRYNIWKDTLKLTDHFHLHSIHVGMESGIRVLLIYLQKSDNNLTKALQKYNGAAKGTAFSDKVYTAIGKFHSFNNKNKYNQEEEVDIKAHQNKVVQEKTG